jgi:hypothetical protein
MDRCQTHLGRRYGSFSRVWYYQTASSICISRYRQPSFVAVIFFLEMETFDSPSWPTFPQHCLEKDDRRTREVCYHFRGLLQTSSRNLRSHSTRRICAPAQLEALNKQDLKENHLRCVVFTSVGFPLDKGWPRHFLAIPLYLVPDLHSPATDMDFPGISCCQRYGSIGCHRVCRLSLSGLWRHQPPLELRNDDDRRSVRSRPGVTTVLGAASSLISCHVGFPGALDWLLLFPKRPVPTILFTHDGVHYVGHVVLPCPSRRLTAQI